MSKLSVSHFFSPDMSKGMSKAVLLPTVQTDTMEVTLLTRLLACVAYGAVSVSITLFNKAVFSYYKFNFPNLFTTLQILVSLLYMIILRSLKVMDFGAVTWKTSKQVGNMQCTQSILA